jgi:hypothetical protein
MRKSQKRIELGEAKWEEYQKERKRKKALRYYNQDKSRTSGYRIRLKKKLIEYKGGKCEICGYQKDVPGAFVFHHRDPKEKSFQIARYNGGLKVLKKEVDKCDLLCANCHAEVHDEERKEDRLRIEKEHSDRFFNFKECLSCHNFFKPVKRTQKYCDIKCWVKVKNRPSKTELKKLIADLPWTRIGEKYGVSDNAVRKWARKYELII